MQRVSDSAYSIVAQYQAEYRGVVQYYRLAYNLHRMSQLKWVMETSLARTLAKKFKTTKKKIFRRFKTLHQNEHGIYKVLEVTTDRGPDKTPLVARFGGVTLRWNRWALINDTKSKPIWSKRSEVVERLLAQECELCCGLMDDRIAHSGGLTLDYLKERSCDYFIEVYSEITRRDYYIPGTIFPHIIFSSYFQSHYELAHVFAIENSWKERSFSYTFYMLLFKKRNKPIELPAIDYNLKKQVYDVQKRGQLTEIIGIFDLPDRKQTVLSADTVRYQNQEIVIHEEPLQQLWTFAEKDEVLLQIDADTSFDRYDGWGYLKVQQAGHLRRIRFKLEALSTTGMILRSNSSVVQSFLSFRPDQFLPVKVELPIVGLSDIAYIRLSVECDMPIPELQIRDLMIFGWPKRLNHIEF